MNLKPPELDESATFVGMLLGLVIGALYTLMRNKRRGATRRKDLLQFGAGTAELEIEASLTEAKRKARSRLAEKS